jgi:hypothetical protein
MPNVLGIVSFSMHKMGIETCLNYDLTGKSQSIMSSNLDISSCAI